MRNVAGPDPLSPFSRSVGRGRFPPATLLLGTVSGFLFVPAADRGLIVLGGLKGTLAGLFGAFLVRPTIPMVWKGCSLGGRVKMCRMQGWKNGIVWIRAISRLPQIALFRVA